MQPEEEDSNLPEWVQDSTGSSGYLNAALTQPSARLPSTSADVSTNDNEIEIENEDWEEQPGGALRRPETGSGSRSGEEDAHVQRRLRAHPGEGSSSRSRSTPTSSTLEVKFP